MSRTQNYLSILAVGIILTVFLIQRFAYFTNNDRNGYNATSWDALGYYLYLPSTFIYDDVKELKWFPEKDSIYQMSGGHFYQGIQLENGNYSFKYLSGVAIMETPFFFIGHQIAEWENEPQDGFSWPYQYAILFGAIFWFFIGLLILRKVLLVYFNEWVTAITLLLLCVTSNLIQYVSVDGAMSHSFIFPLYAAVLWYTIKWHKEPKLKYAILIGIISGIAVISRPTELIIMFIPLLWKFEPTNVTETKWQFLKRNKSQLVTVIGGGILGILPQLLYWKYTTGSFIFDVGSKWYFLNPWWRVLFGPEKGWFLYTPVAILMVAGFFFMKDRPFKRSVLIFCLLNIWIIISWSDWKYGASYSTRALTHSYPVFAMALACIVEYLWNSRYKWWLPVLGVLLIWLNFTQLKTYNSGILEGFSPLLSLF